MATVPDLSGNSPIGFGTDRKLMSPNRTNAGDPTGSLTPQYCGELVHDTTNKVFWRAYGTTSSQWIPAEVVV